MRLLQLLLTVGFTMCCIDVYGAGQNTQGVNAEPSDWSQYTQPHKEQVPVNLQFLGRNVFGPDFTIFSYILPQARFLYGLYAKAKGEAVMFVDLVQRNKKGLSVDQCIAILKKNEQALRNVGEKIDKVYAASYKISKGLLSGAAVLGGLFGIYKSSQMIQDMYWRKRYNRDEVENMAFAKIAQMEEAQKPGFFKRFFVGEQPSFLQPIFSQEHHKEYTDYLKTIKVPEHFGKEEKEALNKKYNLFGTNDLGNYITQYGMATQLSIYLYAGGAYNLYQFLQTAYRASQQKKLEHEQLVKDKETCEKMLQILQSI